MSTDAGRCSRPLLVVDQNQTLPILNILPQLSNFSWDDLLRNHYIEMIDVEEEERTLIAMFPSDLVCVSKC